MGRHSLFLNWKIQNCKDVDSPQLDLQVQTSMFQNLSKVFYRHEKITLKFYEKAKGLEFLNNLEKEESVYLI